MGLQILGVFLILVGLFCGFIAYMEAGGMHGWDEFLYRWPEALFRGDALTALLATATFLLIGFSSFFAGRKKRRSGKASAT